MAWHFDRHKMESKTFFCAVMVLKGMGKLFSLFLALFSTLPIAHGQTYEGFHFLDNLLPERFGPDNGYADYILDIPIPERVSIILKFI